MVADCTAIDMDGEGGDSSSCEGGTKLDGGGAWRGDSLIGHSVSWVDTMTRAFGGAVSSSSSSNDKSFAISSRVGRVTSIVVAVPIDPSEESRSWIFSPVCWLTGGRGMPQ